MKSALKNNMKIAETTETKTYVAAASGGVSTVVAGGLAVQTTTAIVAGGASLTAGASIMAVALPLAVGAGIGGAVWGLCKGGEALYDACTK